MEKLVLASNASTRNRTQSTSLPYHHASPESQLTFILRVERDIDNVFRHIRYFADFIDLQWTIRRKLTFVAHFAHFRCWHCTSFWNGIVWLIVKENATPAVYPDLVSVFVVYIIYW